MSSLPIVVFDLDFTVWDAGGTWCDHLDPPFSISDGRVVDRYDSHVRLYPDVRDILEELSDAGHFLSVASRTGRPDWARELMELLEIRHLFEHEEIYPGSKVTHFRGIAEASGSEYANMVFFDDEHRNIVEVGALGVHAVHVTRGLKRGIVTSALDAIK